MIRKAQIDFSKNSISEAFFKLLQKYEFDKITISQIAAEAGISRATFYRHFDSLESIVEYTSDYFIQDGLNKLSELESPTLMDLIRWRLEIAHDLRHLRDVEEHPDIKNILKMLSPDRLQNFSHILDFSKPYKVTFNFAGFQAVISEWAKNGYKESVDEMCEIIINLIAKD